MLTKVLSLLAACAMASATAPKPPEWIGMSQDSAGAPIEVFVINSDTTKGESIISFTPDTPSEITAMDSFRCIPYGTVCVVTTTDEAGMSFLYRISIYPDPAVVNRTILGGTAHNLHIDLATGTAFTVRILNSSMTVLGVLNGQVEELVSLDNVTRPGDQLLPGATTACSDNKALWVSLRGAGGNKDLIITLALLEKAITNTREVDALPASLWSRCIDSTSQNTLGGSNMTGSVAAYGFLGSDGAFNVIESATIPQRSPPLELTPLLSQPLHWGYFMALYPRLAPGSGPASWGNDGVFALGKFTTGAQLELHSVDYRIVGAAAMGGVTPPALL